MSENDRKKLTPENDMLYAMHWNGLNTGYLILETMKNYDVESEVPNISKETIGAVLDLIIAEYKRIGDEHMAGFLKALIESQEHEKEVHV